MTRKTIKTFAIIWSLLGLAVVSVHFVPSHSVTEQPARSVNTTSPKLEPVLATTGPAPVVDTSALATDPRVQQVTSAPALAKYLDELEGNARKNGAVTDELSRASEAAKRLPPSQAVARRMFDFADRMRHLSFELKWAPLQNELTALREKIASERNAAAREKLVADYNLKTERLPPAGRLAAAETLNKTLAGS